MKRIYCESWWPQHIHKVIKDTGSKWVVELAYPPEYYLRGGEKYAVWQKGSPYETLVKTNDLHKALEAAECI